MYRFKAADIARYVLGEEVGNRGKKSEIALDKVDVPALQSTQILEEDCKMSLKHGEGSIYQPEDGTWRCAFYYRDSTAKKKKRKIVSADTREGAIQKMMDFKQSLPPEVVSPAITPMVPDEPVMQNTMTYGDLYREYWSYWSAKQREDITRDNKRRIFEVHILPVFQDMPLAQIKPQHIQQFLNNLLMMESGETRSKNSLTKIYTVLKSALLYAHAMGYMSKLPTYGVELPDGTTSHKDNKYFNRTTLVEHLVDMHSNPKYYMMAMILLATGLRPEEFLVLRWSNIDWTQKTLKITNAMSQKINPEGGRGAKYFFEEGKTKNASSVRTIYMSDTLVATLTRWRAHMVESGRYAKAAAQGKEDFIILNDDGNLFLYSSLVANYHKHIKANGQFKHKMNFYMFRHSFATYMNQCGVTESIISDQMGHSLSVNGDKASITRTVYISNTTDGYIQAAEIYNKFLQGLESEVQERLKIAPIAPNSLQTECNLRRIG